MLPIFYALGYQMRCYMFVVLNQRSALKSLRNLFIHLNWPLGPTHTSKVVSRDQQEMELERLVMGQEYDSVSRGKFTAGMPWTKTWKVETEEETVLLRDDSQILLAY
jgi:hypothetical protein